MLFCTSVPTLQGTAGHGHLSCLFRPDRGEERGAGGQGREGPSPLNRAGAAPLPVAQQWALLSLLGYTNQGGDPPSAHKGLCHFDTGNQSARLYEKP